MGHFLSFGTRGQPLKLPILHDRLPKVTEVGQTLGVRMCKCLFFQLFIFAWLGFSTVLNIDLSFTYNPIIHTSSILIVAKIKSGKEKSMLLQGFWTDTQIFD